MMLKNQVAVMRQAGFEIQVPLAEFLLTRRKCAGPARRTFHIFLNTLEAG